MKKDVVVVHYGELTLKKGSRRYFVRKLRQNIQVAFHEQGVAVREFYGRLVLEHAEDTYFEDNREAVTETLKAIPGVANFAFALQTDGGFEEMCRLAVELAEGVECSSFAVRAKRSEKSFPVKTMEMERELGSRLVEEYGWNVDLTNPELTVYVLATSEGQFVFMGKQMGPGGLPLGSSGAGVVLLSSGIDSPVAARQMMIRGLKPVYLHFHSYPLTSNESIENVKELVTVLQKHQPGTKLILAPLAELQKAVVQYAPTKLRILLYRRAMYQIAEEFAKRHKAKALVTGESLGQVASQTLENITVTNAAVSMPVLRPLIGMDKEQITVLARQYNTYDISILPYEDCCSLLNPAAVETRAELDQILEAEAAVENWEELKKQVIEQSDILHV